MKTLKRKYGAPSICLMAALPVLAFGSGLTEAHANQAIAAQTEAVRSAATETISASPWVASDYARIRLIPGAIRTASTGDGKTELRSVGVEIELDPGWHTYWRNPGASGVPPRFDWSNSTNLAAAKVQWPAPRRIRDEYGVSFGYNDHVVFPVHIRSKVAGQNTSLKLAIDYAVCREICIPVFAELSLEMPAAAQAPPDLMASIANYEARVPQRQTQDQTQDKSGETNPRIEHAKIQLNDGKPFLAVTADFGASSLLADIFIEGPDEFFFVTPDKPQDLGDGRGLYLVEIKGAETAEDLAGAKLGCTIVGVSGSTEHWWTVPEA